MLNEGLKKKISCWVRIFSILALEKCQYFLLQLLFVGLLLSHFSCHDNVNCVASIINLKGQTPWSICKGEFDNLEEKKPKKLHLFKPYAECLTLLITKPSYPFPQPETMKIQHFVLFPIKLSKFWNAASF